MFRDIVELLIYSGALDIYRKINLGEINISQAETIAVLKIVGWENRPACIRKGE
jgi:hypothetical protein